MRTLLSFKHPAQGGLASLVFPMLSLGVSFGFIAVVFAVGYASHFGLPSGVAKQDYLSLGRQTESGRFLLLPQSALELIYETAPEISWFHAEPLFDLRLRDRNGMQRPLQARHVSNNYFAVLDVGLHEAKALPNNRLEPAAVVSDALWRSLRGANEETEGAFLYLEGDIALLAATFALAVAQVSRFAMKTSRSFAWSADPTTMSARPATRGMLMFVAAISLMFVFSLVNRYLGDTRAPLGFRNLNATIISVSSSNLAALVKGVTQQRIRAAISGVPTVQSAAQASMMPLSTVFQGSHHEVTLVGNTDLGPRRMFANRVTPDYFRTLDVKLLAGRFFAAQARNEIVVARSTAEMLANTVEQSLGMTLTLPATAAVSASPGTSLPAGSVKVVVGVVADIPYGHYSDQPRPVIYENAGGERSGTDWIVRHNGDPADIVASLEKSGASENWMVAVAGTPASRLQEQFTAKRSVEILLSGAAGFALVLALAGIAASLAGAITADRKRIGISLAPSGSESAN